jgi:ribosomal protein S18 acetylase RimI-like enzyme
VDVRELHAALVDMVRTWIQTGTAVREAEYGLIIRDVSHPLVHDANLAWVDHEPAGGIEAVARDLDTVFLGTDVHHRFALFADAQVAYDHQNAFAAAGFRPHAELVMAKVGLPSCIVNPDLEIREVGEHAPEDDYRLVQTKVHEETGYGAEESRQVFAVDRNRAAAVGERTFVGYVHDEPAATYKLWPRGSFALIGNVATHPAFRMRGIGRTMIFDACRRSMTARCEYALLTTDLFDTPQAMYKTLGFEPVGELRGFLRPQRLS